MKAVPSHAEVSKALDIGVRSPFGTLVIRDVDGKGNLGLCLSRDGKTADVVAVVQPNQKRIATALWSWMVVETVKGRAIQGPLWFLWLRGRGRRLKVASRWLAFPFLWLLVKWREARRPSSEGVAR